MLNPLLKRNKIIYTAVKLIDLLALSGAVLINQSLFSIIDTIVYRTNYGTESNEHPVRYYCHNMLITSVCMITGYIKTITFLYLEVPET